MKSIGEFLDLYPKRNSKLVYRAGIHAFLEFIYGSNRSSVKATKKEMVEFEKLAEQYFSEKRDYADDLVRFAASLHTKPPMSAKSYMAGVKEYLGYNGVELTQRQLKTIRLKLPKGNARTVEKDMDSTTIRTILQHMDVKGNALVLTVASSGMRIGEALQIELEDVLPYLENNPVMITIRGEYTKTGEQRFVFISREAKDALIEWLKVREQYLKAAVNKNKGLVNNGIARTKMVDDDRIFPFTQGTAEQIWNNALTNSGLLSVDKGTNRKQLRIHQLRKFFRSQLALDCPVDIVEALMGHEGYLTEAYRRYTKAQMAEYYLKNERYITIAQNQSVEAIKKEITSEMNEAIKGLVVENQGLQSKNKELEDKLTRLEKVVKVVAKVAMEDPSLLPAMKDFMKD